MGARRNAARAALVAYGVATLQFCLHDDAQVWQATLAATCLALVGAAVLAESPAAAVVIACYWHRAARASRAARGLQVAAIAATTRNERKDASALPRRDDDAGLARARRGFVVRAPRRRRGTREDESRRRRGATSRDAGGRVAAPPRRDVAERGRTSRGAAAARRRGSVGGRVGGDA